MKKYLSKTDKLRGIISPEYAEHLQQKERKKKWRNEVRQTVIDTLPERLAKQFDTYDFKKFPKKKVSSMYVYGEVDTGKTVLSAYYYVDFVRQMFLQQSSFTKTYEFVIYSRMIENLQRDFSTAHEFIQKYTECDLLVIDEFGLKKLTDYVYDRVYQIINERHLRLLPTVINSNYNLEGIGRLFNDSRIIRRIQEDYELIEKL